MDSSDLEKGILYLAAAFLVIAYSNDLDIFYNITVGIMFGTSFAYVRIHFLELKRLRLELELKRLRLENEWKIEEIKSRLKESTRKYSQKDEE